MGRTGAVTELMKYSDLPAHIRSHFAVSPGLLYREGGKLYLSLSPETVLCCEDLPETVRLLDSIRRFYGSSRPFPRNREEFLLQVITGTFPADCSFRPEQYRLTEPLDRCIILFRIETGAQGKKLYDLFSAMIPVNGKDVFLSVDHLTTALIQDCSHTTNDEIAEYAEAVIGTFESEGIVSVCAGIGRRAETILGLRNSFLDAHEALALGKKYHSSGTVFQYGRQTLERILECIPDDKKQAIRKEFFARDEGRMLSDELLDTVREFFRNDLNLTATSKQLFIHRNTLNYRLDKIKKEFGLDLRRFEDAVVFRIVSELPGE